MSHYDIVRNLFAPKRKAYAALYNPAAPGSLIGTQSISKSINVNAWIVGLNNLLTANGGTVRIESLVLIVTTSFTSGAAPTLGFGFTNDPNRLTGGGGIAVGALQATRDIYLQDGVSGIQQTGHTDLAYMGTSRPAAISNVSISGPIILPSGQSLLANVGAAVYTGGVLAVKAIYTPIDSGATLT